MTQRIRIILAVLLLAAISAGPLLASPAGETPAAEGPRPTLRYLGPVWAVDPNKSFEAGVVEKVTGYKVAYEALPSENTAEKLNLLVASGEPYDVITVNGRLKEESVNFAKQGALLDLGPLMKSLGPNLLKAMPEKSFDFFAIDGKRYLIPSKLPLEYVRTFLFVRADWLAKVGAAEPRTPDELAAVLTLFKDKDPGGQAIKNLPMTMAAPDTTHGLLGAFGIANYWNEQGGKLVALEESEGFRDYLTFMAGLYSQGLLDREFPANKDATVQEKILSGRAGVAPFGVFNSERLTVDLAKNVPGATWAPLPALVGKNGARGFMQDTGYDFVTYIPKTAKHPQDAMKWMNIKLEPTNFRTTVLGYQDTHYTYNNGQFRPILPIFQTEMGGGWFFLTGTIEKDYATYWLEVRLRRITQMYDGFQAVQAKAGKDVQLDAVNLAVGLTTYAKKKVELQAMTRDFMTKVIAGAEPLSSIDAYVKKWRDAGGAASTTEINAWYEKHYKK